MASIREMSENKIGDDATIIQGDFNATFNTNLQNDEVEKNRLFLEKISKTDPFYDKKRILELKGPFLRESFEWILDHEDFQRWRNIEESGALWIKGDPGKGKTMLLCGIVNDLENNPGTNSNLGYFFCQATDDRINTAIAAVGGLIYSFLEPRQELLRHLLSGIRKKFETKLSQLSGPNAWQILCDIFEAIIQDEALPNVVCVVDALDECEHDVESLLRFIAKTSCQVKWLISSRNVKEIELGLRSIDDSRRLVLELTSNAMHVSQSVSAYIDDSTRDIVALADDEELRIKTISTLKLKSDGSFLWVSLVVKELRDTDRRNIEGVLEELPAGLENLYDLMMKRIAQKLRKKDQNVCHILLAIVTAVERPLELEELLEFIKFQWTDYKRSYNVRDMEDIVRDCGPFLSIKEGTVYLDHQSVKNYMVGKGAKTIFPLGVENQHLKMFKNSLCSMSSILTCNIYRIKAPATERNNISPPHPDPLAPIAYCCVFWVRHLIQCCQFGTSSIDELLRDDGVLHTFLRDKFLCWLEALILLRQFSHGTDDLYKLWSISPKFRSSAYGREKDSNLDNSLETFIDDARKFVQNCEFCAIEYYPLQLYYVPFVFGNKNNTVNKTFQETIHARFGDLPTCVLSNVPLRRFFLLQTFKPENILCDFLLFSPDSSLLCVPQTNGTIYLWKTQSGILERVIKLNLDVQGMQLSAKPGVDYYIAFSKDSSQINFLSSKGVVQMWLTEDKAQAQRHHLQFMDETERIIALSQDGNLAASVNPGGIGQLVNIWTTETGDRTQTIHLENTSSIFSATFSPDSTLIALIEESGVIIYPIHTEKDTCIQRLRRPSALSWNNREYEDRRLHTFSPNSEVFAYVYDRVNVELWCTNTWTIIQCITPENFVHYKRINHFAFSPDSATFMLCTDNNLLFGSTTTGQCQRHALPSGSKGCIVSSSWSWKSSLLLAIKTDVEAEVWLFNSEDVLAEADDTDFLSGNAICVSSDSQLIAALDHEKRDINIIAAERGEIARVLKRKSSIGGKPAFSSDSYLLAVQADDTDDIHIWDINAGTVIQRLQRPGYVGVGTAVAFSYDSKSLVTSSMDVIQELKNHWQGLVRVWHVESGHLLNEFGFELRNKEITAIAISTGLKFVAICDYGHGVQLWEPLTGHLFRYINQGFADDLQFSSDSKCLAVMYREWGRVQIWEIATGVCLTDLGTRSGDYNISFDPFNGDVGFDRFIYKTSNWKHWHQVRRHGYSYNGSWICLDGQETLFIPTQFANDDEARPVISSSLIAYKNRKNQLTIIKFPDHCGFKG